MENTVRGNSLTFLFLVIFFLVLLLLLLEIEMTAVSFGVLLQHLNRPRDCQTNVASAIRIFFLFFFYFKILFNSLGRRRNGVGEE